MSNLTTRPVAPVRAIDPIVDLAARGAELSDAEISLGKLEQANLDEAYVAAFAAYEKDDAAYEKAFVAKTGEKPSGARAKREKTQVEINKAKGRARPSQSQAGGGRS